MTAAKELARQAALQSRLAIARKAIGEIASSEAHTADCGFMNHDQ